MKNYTLIIGTYNGGSYIAEQLLSVLQQKWLPSQIIISDDGSTDDTLSIVQKIFISHHFSHYQIIDAPHKGVIHNFLSALHFATGDYIFFADQDDTWLPNKVEVFFEHIDSTSQTPMLAFSDARLISSDGQLLHASFFDYQGLSANFMNDDSIIYKSCVQGAACCINTTLKDLIIKSLPYIQINNLYMHDWWFSLLAHYYGDVIFIDQALIDYRQHQENQIGVFNKHFRFYYYIKNYLLYFKNFRQAIRQMKELEIFVQSYAVKPIHELKCRKLRQYRYLSKIKLVIVRLLGL